MEKLRGGMIGCGFFGGIQREAWGRIPEVEIVAAADPDLARASAFAPHAYASAQEMLERERLDFVDIATRPATHLGLVRLAAAHKLPIICQKPMADTWAECLAIVEAAETAGVRLMIHENWRWQPWYRAAKEMVSGGAIGTPVTYFFRSRRGDARGPEPFAQQPYFMHMPRLVIHETVVHNIDTARFLFGGVTHVYAEARRIHPAIAGEDHAALTLTHAGGLIGIADCHRHLEFDGPVMGDAAIEGDAGFLHVASSGDIFVDGKQAWTNTYPHGYRGDSVFFTQRHFIECLRTGAKFESEARDYLCGSVAVVEAAYRSIETHSRITIEAHAS